MAGTSGNAAARVALVTANARSFPVLTYSIVDAEVPKYAWTWPPRRSMSAGPPPR
jgi:hypothetical protein